MRCPECNHANQPTARFCVRCSHALFPGAQDRGTVRKTQAEEGLFERAEAPFEVPPPAPVKTPPPPAASAPRRTQLEEAQPSRGNGSAPPRARGRTQLDTGEAPELTPPPSSSRIVGWAISYDRDPQGASYVIRAGRTRIGRSRDSDIALFFDGKASEHHATIVWRNGQAAVKDEASTNGTLVNGEDIGIGSTASLASGDRLTVGGQTFLIFLVNPELAREVWPESAWASR